MTDSARPAWAASRIAATIFATGSIGHSGVFMGFHCLFCPCSEALQGAFGTASAIPQLTWTWYMSKALRTAPSGRRKRSLQSALCIQAEVCELPTRRNSDPSRLAKLTDIGALRKSPGGRMMI